MTGILARLVAAAALAAVALPARAPAAGLPSAPLRSAAAVGRSSFAPNDPMLAKQWYLQADDALRAFSLWPTIPTLPGNGVRIAIVDSGIDGTHPDFPAGRVALARSFVGGSPTVDEQGHGTFVAGEIGAAIDNGIGIAGIAFPAQLLIAKVVRPDGTISLQAEAHAIRWAADNGARVINLSIGGVRDPTDPKLDTYSRLEAAAVAYAYSKGAVVVAAVGNADQAPATPWNFASYPAALPHVIGVSALARDGSVPSFSDRDPIYNDISAPGEAILSTFPLSLTGQQPACPDQGYSDCADDEYRNAEGTSFAAPQVSAAAALLFAARPSLTPDQVSYILERSAHDVSAATGCTACPLGRDALSGWGSLDIAAALAALNGPLPPPDTHEPNDDAGSQAARLYGRTVKVTATLDFWDDQIDVYSVYLRKGQWLSVALKGPSDIDISLDLWKPGTQQVEGLTDRPLDKLIQQAAKPGSREQLLYRAAADGWYYIEAKVITPTPSWAQYTLGVTKSLLG